MFSWRKSWFIFFFFSIFTSTCSSYLPFFFFYCLLETYQLDHRGERSIALRIRGDLFFTPIVFKKDFSFRRVFDVVGLPPLYYLIRYTLQPNNVVFPHYFIESGAFVIRSVLCNYLNNLRFSFPSIGSYRVAFSFVLITEEICKNACFS